MDAWKIIPYAPSFRDDMIFMVLQAKDALGKVPSINPDLLDVQANYLDKGDRFWLAIDANDRVLGCIGYSSMGNGEARLHRLYVKAAYKRQGIGSALLETAEAHLRAVGMQIASVHMGGEEYWESYHFYPKHGYTPCGERMMRKTLIDRADAHV